MVWPFDRVIWLEAFHLNSFKFDLRNWKNQTSNEMIQLPGSLEGRENSNWKFEVLLVASGQQRQQRYSHSWTAVKAPRAGTGDLSLMSLVKMVWIGIAIGIPLIIIIYLLNGFLQTSNFSINQPTNGKRTSIWQITSQSQSQSESPFIASAST